MSLKNAQGQTLLRAERASDTADGRMKLRRLIE
jgi:hypothetical protein